MTYIEHYKAILEVFEYDNWDLTIPKYKLKHQLMCMAITSLDFSTPRIKFNLDVKILEFLEIINDLD